MKAGFRGMVTSPAAEIAMPVEPLVLRVIPGSEQLLHVPVVVAARSRAVAWAAPPVTVSPEALVASTKTLIKSETVNVVPS